jgi:tetratricopeptide (TPR) repeat protein
MAQAQTPAARQLASRQIDQLYADLEAKYPRSAAVLDSHGNSLWLAGRKDDAFAKWREAGQLDPANPDICLHLGTCWLERGDTLRATTYFQRASALAPDDPILHFQLGNDLYLFRHDLVTPTQPETAVVDQALRELKRASDLDPLNPTFAKGYADTFYSIPVPRWAEALKAWQHFYDISPEKDLAAINLARVSLQMRDHTAARHYLAQVTRPDFQPLKQKLLRQAQSPAAE